MKLTLDTARDEKRAVKPITQSKEERRFEYSRTLALQRTSMSYHFSFLNSNMVIQRLVEDSTSRNSEKSIQASKAQEKKWSIDLEYIRFKIS